MPPRMRVVRAKPKPPPPPRNVPKTSKPPKQPPSSESAKTNPNIHRDRAKRWGTNPWIAEWLANAVEYMKAPKAQKDFEDWVLKSFPAEEASKILRECKDPPVKCYGPSTGNAKMWNSAAVELGVSDTAMKNYHKFTAGKNLVEPTRIKPAASRRRGERSSTWLVRRSESLLQGFEVPDIDWEEARRIAFSQLDETKDIYEVWHTDCDYFIGGIIDRAESTIPAPQVMEYMKDPLSRDFQLRTDAYRSRLHLLHLARAHWTLAVSLFEEFDRRGLQKTSAIEAAYNADPRFKWQMVGVASMTATYASKISARTVQVLAALPAFCHYFKRYRTMQGDLRIEADQAYISAHHYPRNSIDELIVQIVSDNHISLDIGLSEMKEHLGKFPQEALKFDAYAWREIGDYLVVTHFFQEICSSHFGRRLLAAAEETKTMSGSSLDIVYEEVAFMSRSELSKSISLHHKYEYWTYGRCRGIVEAMADLWLGAIFNTDLTADIIAYHLQFGAFQGFNVFFDKSWYDADKYLWEKASRLDPPGKGGKGKVARLLGLYDVMDANRPCWAKRILLLAIGDSQAQSNALNVTESGKARSFVSSIPVAGPLDSAVQSGHAYVTEANLNKDLAKQKVKTRGSSIMIDEPQAEGSLVYDVDEEEIPVPDLLPENFKLPRKIHKVFQRILENDDDVNLAPDAPKKGQVRWDDFEKAMRRVGFDVVQTTGSSVRFDPPAKTARPISFHRPHPDSLLTPFLIKWIGGRLNRCYGWTTATFLLATSDGIEPMS